MDTTTAATRDIERAQNRLARVKTLAAAGLTAGQIGAKMGKTAGWVSDLARAHGVKLRVPHDDVLEVPAARVRLALIADPEPWRVYERRRADCARLEACEDAWILAHVKSGITAGAACPKDCPGVAR